MDLNSIIDTNITSNATANSNVIANVTISNANYINEYFLIQNKKYKISEIRTYLNYNNKLCDFDRNVYLDESSEACINPDEYYSSTTPDDTGSTTHMNGKNMTGVLHFERDNKIYERIYESYVSINNDIFNTTWSPLVDYDKINTDITKLNDNDKIKYLYDNINTHKIVYRNKKTYAIDMIRLPNHIDKSIYINTYNAIITNKYNIPADISFDLFHFSLIRCIKLFRNLIPK
jgi:hypothetical protein